MHEKIKNRIIKNNHFKKLYIFVFFDFNQFTASETYAKTE